MIMLDFNFFLKGPKISPNKFHEIKHQVQVLDVRDREEIKDEEINYFPNYHLIPLSLLSEYYSRLDPNETYYILCHSGARSIRAANILTKYNIKNIVIDHGVVGLEKYIYENK